MSVAKTRKPKSDELNAPAPIASDEPVNASPVHPFPKLAICSPLQGERVALTENVRGCAEVDDPTLLSLLVLSNNGKYYLQGGVQANGEIWNADAQFGDPDTPGNEYQIVAVYGAVLTLRRYDKIPDGLIQSNIVTVRRPF